MAAPQSVTSLRAYYNVPAHTVPPKDLVASLTFESDRSLVVILGSMLEDRLAWAIRAKLHPEADVEALRIFAPDGAMGTFSSKIKVANALGIISDLARDTLDDIREMRNACAHSVRAISFETKQLIAVHRRLFLPGRSMISPPSDYPDNGATRRAMFTLQCMLLGVQISEGEEAARALLKEQPPQA